MSDDVSVLGSYWTLAGDTNPPPLNGREWSQFAFEDRVRKATEVGFDGIGIWHTDLIHILEDQTLDDMRATLDRYGVEHVELEFLDQWFLPTDDHRRREADNRWRLLLEAAEALDAHHIKVGNITGESAPLSRVSENFRHLCSEAGEIDTLVGYEPMPFDVNISTLDDVFTVAGDVENGGVVLDLWHMVKMSIAFDDLRRIPIDQIVSVELNDGYLESEMDLVVETTSHRMLPGDGEFDIRAFTSVIQEIGYDGPWGVEVLSEELRQLPMDELYESTYESTVSMLE